MLKYSLARLLLFLVCFGAFYLLFSTGVVRAPGGDVALWSLLLSAVVSMALSFWLLRPMRERVSQQINERVARGQAARAQRDQRSADELAEDAESARDER